MNKKSRPAKKSPDNKLVVKRLINAPREMVYRAWTEPKLMVQWLSPEDVKCRSVELHLKVGGAFRIHMVSKKGDHIAVGKYKQIVPNKRLRFTWEWEKYAMPHSLMTIDFEDLGKRTRVTLIHEGFPDREDLADHKKGWTSALRKFAGLMKKGKIKG